MFRARALIVVALLATTAHADEPVPSPGEPCPLTCRVAKVRDLLARDEVTAARDELVKVYQLYPDPQLLFALGQVELQLGNNEAAIGYYERFIATDPSEDQIALAQQAIGAARMRLAQPKDKPVEPPPPLPPAPRRYERRWDTAGTVIVIAGGAAILAGGGLLYNAHQIGNDTSGTLAEYDDRLEHAQFRRFAGVGIAAAGAIALGVALVRWRFDRTEVAASPSAGGATVSVSRRW
jgi:tetratricopeptide (TPR) repeat protein